MLKLRIVWRSPTACRVKPELCLHSPAPGFAHSGPCSVGADQTTALFPDDTMCCYHPSAQAVPSAWNALLPASLALTYFCPSSLLISVTLS